MRAFSLLAVCVVVGLLLADGAEARKTRGGSSRGGSKGSRGSSRRQPQPQQPANTGLSHSGLASLSYPGYNSQAAKPKPQPSAPQPHPAPKKPDTAVKKEVGQSQSNPNNPPAYPPAGGSLSGSGGAAGGQAHAYPPASNGLSGSPAQGGAAHAYPPSSGLSGAGGANQQHAYPASNGLSGSGHPQGPPPPYSPNVPAGHNAYPANNYPANPGYNNNPYGAPGAGYPNQGHPPPYSPQGHGGMPGYGGAPGGYGGAPGGFGGHQGGYGGQQGGYGGQQGYGGMGGFGGGGFGGGGYNNFGGYYGKPKSSFLSGNKFGLILAGLAVWNLARSGSRTTHNHYYNKDDPNAKHDPANPNLPDPILEDLVNCTLTMTSVNDTDVVLIPCFMATSFSPDAKLAKGSTVPVFVPDSSSPLNCTITVLTKNLTEVVTNIPCESLSNLAPKNMTENPPGVEINDPEPPLEVIPLSTPSTTTVLNGADPPPTSSVNPAEATSSTTINPAEGPLSSSIAPGEVTTPKPE